MSWIWGEHHGSRNLQQKLSTSWWTGSKEKNTKRFRAKCSPQWAFSNKNFPSTFYQLPIMSLYYESIKGLIHWLGQSHFLLRISGNSFTDPLRDMFNPPGISYASPVDNKINRQSQQETGKKPTHRAGSYSVHQHFLGKHEDPSLDHQHPWKSRQVGTSVFLQPWETQGNW